MSAAIVRPTCPIGSRGCTLACLFGETGCVPVEGESVAYVVETSTVSFGQRVTVILERGVSTRDGVERAAGRHRIITGWTTPAARILEGVHV